jgi:mannose-6-phosphate isomerase-like protein (cupin superfamily)
MATSDRSTKAEGIDLAPRVDRAGSQSVIDFGPTSTFRFIASGGPGLPDLYEERDQRGDSAPLHSHPWPSWELVIEGEIRVVVGEDEHVLGTGDAIYLPPDVPHTYVVESETAHLIGMNLSNGRFESLQRQAAPLFNGDGAPDMEAVIALAAEHDVDLLGPPLSPKSR